MQAELKWLTDPTVFRVNRLDAHSGHVCYASTEEAQRGESFPAAVPGRAVALCLEPESLPASRGLLAPGL